MELFPDSIFPNDSPEDKMKSKFIDLYTPTDVLHSRCANQALCMKI